MKYLFNVVILSCVLLFNSCHKDESIKQHDHISAVVAQCKQSLIAEGYSLQLIDSVLKNIEISNYSTIPVKDNVSLCLFKTTEVTENVKSFFGMLNIKGKMKSLGFIKTIATTNDNAINTITKFVKAEGELAIGNFIEISKISGELLLRDEKLPNGKLKSQYRTAIPHKNYSTIIEKSDRTNVIASTSTDPIEPPSNCTDWYLVTYYEGEMISEEYVTTTCVAGGSGGSDTYVIGSGDHADDGKLSCRSFAFTPMTPTMYEAGVSGLNFSIQIAGTATVLSFPYRNIYVGFPSLKENSEGYSQGEAAQYAAAAMNRASLSMALKYQFYSEVAARALTTSSLETEFKNLTKLILTQEIGALTNVSYIREGANTITNPAVWNSGWEILWNGLTGSGCK